MSFLRVALISLLMILFTFSDSIAGELNLGDPAPDFTLPYASQDTINFDGITLSDFQGERPVVLAFYPADWSPGCTTQLCNFRDNFHMFDNLNAEVLAISGDYVFAHKAWIQEEQFQFKLLSDHLHKVAKMYNSYRPKLGTNKRTVYIIDQAGTVRYKNMNYTPGDSSDFQALQDQLAGL